MQGGNENQVRQDKRKSENERLAAISFTAAILILFTEFIIDLIK